MNYEGTCCDLHLLARHISGPIQPLDAVPHMQHNNTIKPNFPCPTTSSCLPFRTSDGRYYFTLHGHYLVYADHYTGWVTVLKAPTSGNTTFSLYGVPMELANDAGPQFASHTTQQFLGNWGVKWCVSSAYYSQSNDGAELAVKTAKRLLRQNISPSGDLNTDSPARTLLEYHNTPPVYWSITCSTAVYGRQLCDHLPSSADVLKIRQEWIQLAEVRVRALAQRHLRSMKTYNQHTRSGKLLV